MKKSLILAFGWTVLLIASCATQTIQQGKNLSASGVAYTEAVDNLLDSTTDRVIDFDNEVLKKVRRGPDPREIITQHDEEMAAMLAEIGRFRAQTKLLRAYFLNLQALADSTVKDDAGSAVKSLSDSISKLNKTIGGKDGKENLTEEQKSQIGALGGLVANAIHAAIIKRALTRDAEIIGTYLALQENQLNNITGMLESRFQAENDLFLNEKVIAVYIDRNQSLGSEWGDNRKQWLKSQFLSQQLVTAKEAAKQLRSVWQDIVQGKSDIGSLSMLMSDINNFAVASHALEATKGLK